MAHNFDNMSDEIVADEIGDLNTKIKALEENLQAYKDEFKRRGLSAVKGLNYIVSASTSTTKRLDTKKVRDVLGDALDDSFFTSSDVTRITTKAIKETA
jgi:hypothetical protein